jgi:hypothetical protein
MSSLAVQSNSFLSISYNRSPLESALAARELHKIVQDKNLFWLAGRFHLIRQLF